MLPELPRKLFAEALGTALLLAVVIGSGIMAERLAGGNVAVVLRCDGAMLHLAVQDDGPGIAASEHARVFERFYRGLGHAANGSGLGLAIVRQAVLRMGGQVHVGAGLGGRGVGFFISIPKAPSS